jgi:hypothetical protein
MRPDGHAARNPVEYFKLAAACRLHSSPVMRKIGVVAFGVTTCALVPTALQTLQAGPTQTAKLLAADVQTVQVGDAKVDISVDRGLAQGGGKMKVTLTATADKHTKVPVALLVYEQQGVNDSRVEDPPVRVGRDEVTLDVTGGRASKTVTFTLPETPTAPIDGEFGHYTILVMSPKAAASLDAKRRHAHGIDPGENDPNGFWAAFEASLDPDKQENAKAGAIARLDVYSHTASNHLAIVAGDVARANADIAVKVHVRNPTGRSFPGVAVALATQPENAFGSAWQGIEADHVDIDHNPDASFALKPHESKDIVFHLRTDQTGTLGLLASVACDTDDCFSDGRDGATKVLAASVLDAIDILPADDQNKLAATEVAK